MKTKVLIIEDSPYKVFTMKQLLEAQLRTPVASMTIESDAVLLETTVALNPDVVVFRPQGGVVELLVTMQRRHMNRRNTEITLVMAPDLSDEFARRFQAALSCLTKRVAQAA